MLDELQTSRRRFLVASSTGIATVAGCTGGGSKSTPTTTKTTEKTTTRTTTTENGPTLQSISFPDGATESSVSGDLLLTHKFETSGEAYTIEKQLSDRYRSRRTKIQLGTSKAAQKQVSDKASRSFWKTGSVGLCRANGGVYYYHCDPTIDRRRIGDYRQIRQYLQLGDFSPTGVEKSGGTTFITAKASSATISGDLSRDFKSVDSYDGTLQFTPAGVIHSLSVSMKAARPWDDQPEKTKFVWNGSKFGDTTVSKPSWVPEATKKAFDFAVTSHPEDGYVTLDVTEGSGTLPSHLHISFDNRSERYSANPNIGLSKGDSLYIAPRPDGSLGVSKSGPPSDRAAVTGNYSLRVNVNGPTVIDTSVSL